VVPHAPPASGRALWTRRASISRACALRPLVRPDAAASTASRPADRDDRDTPLSSGRDNMNIILYRGICQELRSDGDVPDAAQRAASPRGTLPIRDGRNGSIRNGPGSAIRYDACRIASGTQVSPPPPGRGRCGDTAARRFRIVGLVMVQRKVAAAHIIRRDAGRLRRGPHARCGKAL